MGFEGTLLDSVTCAVRSFEWTIHQLYSILRIMNFESYSTSPPKISTSAVSTVHEKFPNCTFTFPRELKNQIINEIFSAFEIKILIKLLKQSCKCYAFVHEDYLKFIS